MSDFKLNGLINPNNNDLTTEQELKRVNVVLKGVIIYVLERMSELDNKDFQTVLSELNLSVNRQLDKEDDDFKNLFK
ncbi:MAG: hypothetical protein JXQ65_12020 [Candidatus Marinimicrobia bacterium]|nr:hypothetical protein [Candidatus Neomarinimicrobiota bacterium]